MCKIGSLVCCVFSLGVRFDTCYCLITMLQMCLLHFFNKDGKMDCSCYCLLLVAHIIQKQTRRTAGGRLNKKDGLTRYGNSHVKDKTS